MIRVQAGPARGHIKTRASTPRARRTNRSRREYDVRRRRLPLDVQDRDELFAYGAIVRRDPPAARKAAEQHLRGFSEEVRSTVLAMRA